MFYQRIYESIVFFDIHQKHKYERPNREKFRAFPPRNTCILSEKFNLEMTKIRTFFPKITALSSSFQEIAGETSPSSNALVVIKSMKLLFTRFAIVKLKINLFSVSIIFLKKCTALDPVDRGHNGGSYICYLFRRALFTYFTIIEKMCKTAFSTRFRAMKLKTDACSLFLIFILMNQLLLSFSALIIGLCRKKKV